MSINESPQESNSLVTQQDAALAAFNAGTGETGLTSKASWNFSIDHVQEGLAARTHKEREVLRSAFSWCTDPQHPVSMDELASALGIHKSTLWKVYRGRYVDGQGQQLAIPAGVVGRAEKWLALSRERFIGSTKNLVIQTPTFRKIWTYCDLARESRTVVFMQGVSQLGKTFALEHYTQANNHGRTAYVRLEPATGVTGLIRAIARALRFSEKVNFRELTDRIIKALSGGDSLLILDEVHELVYTHNKATFFICMEKLRQIKDAAGCGLVLCSTELLLARAKENRDELDQLLRRGVHKIHLGTMPSRKDLEAIFGASKLAFPAKEFEAHIPVDGKGNFHSENVRQLVRQMAKEEGLLAITETLRNARKLAAKAEQALSWDHFVQARLICVSASTPDPEWT